MVRPVPHLHFTPVPLQTVAQGSSGEERWLWGFLPTIWWLFTTKGENTNKCPAHKSLQKPMTHCVPFLKLVCKQYTTKFLWNSVRRNFSLLAPASRWPSWLDFMVGFWGQGKSPGGRRVSLCLALVADGLALLWGLVGAPTVVALHLSLLGVSLIFFTECFSAPPPSTLHPLMNLTFISFNPSLSPCLRGLLSTTQHTPKAAQDRNKGQK